MRPDKKKAKKPAPPQKARPRKVTPKQARKGPPKPASAKPAAEQPKPAPATEQPKPAPPPAKPKSTLEVAIGKAVEGVVRRAAEPRPLGKPIELKSKKDEEE